MIHTDIEIPARFLPGVCKLLGCAAEDALEALGALETTEDVNLRHPSGALVLLSVALPFANGIAFRVSGIQRPEVAAAPVVARAHRPLSAWLVDAPVSP